MSEYVALIPAAGVGARAQLKLAKQFNLVGKKTIIEFAIDPFLKDENDDTPYEVAVNDEFTDFTPEIELLKDTMIRKIQNKQLRRMTHKRAKTMRRLALAKSMESQQGPFSSIRYDPSLFEKVSKFL